MKPQIVEEEKHCSWMDLHWQRSLKKIIQKAMISFQSIQLNLSTYMCKANQKHIILARIWFSSIVPLGEILHSWILHYLQLEFSLSFLSGKLNQVRINAYDRAPHEKMTLEAQEKFYEYFPKLIEMSKSPEFKVTFQLNAGETLLVNNYRLLHGRTAFNGKRLLTGCYLSMDCFKSRYNSLKNCFH